ncbi:hypothetical protein [Streptosporangium sp. V21-05]
MTLRRVQAVTQRVHDRKRVAPIRATAEFERLYGMLYRLISGILIK